MYLAGEHTREASGTLGRAFNNVYRRAQGLLYLPKHGHMKHPLNHATSRMNYSSGMDLILMYYSIIIVIMIIIISGK